MSVGEEEDGEVVAVSEALTVVFGSVDSLPATGK